jgi:hypothetical protein
MLSNSPSEPYDLMAARDRSRGSYIYFKIAAVLICNDIRIDALALITNIASNGE